MVPLSTSILLRSFANFCFISTAIRPIAKLFGVYYVFGEHASRYRPTTHSSRSILLSVLLQWSTIPLVDTNIREIPFEFHPHLLFRDNSTKSRTYIFTFCHPRLHLDLRSSILSSPTPVRSTPLRRNTLLQQSNRKTASISHSFASGTTLGSERFRSFHSQFIIASVISSSYTLVSALWAICPFLRLQSKSSLVMEHTNFLDNL